ncbi:MAG: hypothetical protein GWN41_08235 [Phycisphaerae bacterium]|nr:hypothetical protein [Phycisphaerae bacterium]
MGLLDRDVIHSEPCVRAFSRIFWAFLFFLDFRIGINNVHIDVLPDFIGWILMATALGWILGLHSDIKLIRTLSLVSIFLSIFDLIEIKKKVSGISYDISIFFPVGIALAILSIIVIWKLCGVIMDMAEAVGNQLIRERADFRRKLYLAFMIALPVVMVICFVVPPLIPIVAIGGLIAAIVIFCLLMGLMKATVNICVS